MIQRDGDFEESVVVELIDSSLGRSVQRWSFQAQSISIGRSPKCDVALSDKYVSRDHAEIRWFSGEWWIISRGRNGVVVDGKRISEQVISSGTMFRLGSEGPQFRFVHVSPEDLSEHTLSLETVIPAPLVFNSDRLEREVREIEANDYFQVLRQRSKELRSHRSIG